MSLNRFIYTKEILVDDSGWGDLILGTVIGAMKLPDHRYMERRIPVSAFQTPNFENKTYLNEAVKIAQEIIEVMEPDNETCFKVCSGYILSRLRRYLRSRGFHVERTKITGELQEKVERSYLHWCAEVGVPTERLRRTNRFFPLLEWVAEKIELRETLVKTGWKSWRDKWRDRAYEIHLQEIAESRKKYYP